MADFSAVRQSITVGVERICDDAARLLADEIAALDAPIATGNLASDRTVTTVNAGNGAISTVSFNADYASYQQEGTGPHEIRGNPLLAFDGGFGQTVIVHSVQHPGSTVNKGWADKLESDSDWGAACQASLDAYSFD